MLFSSSRSHKGNVRKINEDSVLIHSNYNLYAIADGMGGHSSGDLASQYVISELSKLILTEDNVDLAIEQIEKALITINSNLKDTINLNNKEAVAGCTIVITYIKDGICSCFWAGDSRLYVFRNESLYQITKDHSLVQEMIDNGELSQSDAVGHPKSNVITRAMGVTSEIHIDNNQFEIRQGDKLLLCSDGLYKEINSDVIISSLQEENSDKIANNLLGEVLIRKASDNVSLIVICNQ